MTRRNTETLALTDCVADKTVMLAENISGFIDKIALWIAFAVMSLDEFCIIAVGDKANIL